MPVCSFFAASIHARRVGQWMTVLLLGVLLSACASTGGDANRARLSAEELATLKPQIAEHLRCVSAAVDHGLPGTHNAIALVDDATNSCQRTLTPLAERLKGFSLSAKAHQRYMQAISTASRDAVLRSMTTRQASAATR